MTTEPWPKGSRRKTNSIVHLLIGLHQVPPSAWSYLEPSQTQRRVRRQSGSKHTMYSTHDSGALYGWCPDTPELNPECPTVTQTEILRTCLMEEGEPSHPRSMCFHTLCLTRLGGPQDSGFPTGHVVQLLSQENSSFNRELESHVSLQPFIIFNHMFISSLIPNIKATSNYGQFWGPRDFLFTKYLLFCHVDTTDRPVLPKSLSSRVSLTLLFFFPHSDLFCISLLCQLLIKAYASPDFSLSTSLS